MMPDTKDERIERGRDILQQMEKLIERYTPRPNKPHPNETRGDSWGADGQAAGVVRGVAKTPYATPKK